MILITGAGGRLGKELVAQLAARGETLRVSGLTERPWFADHEAVLGDLFNPAVARRAVAGVEAIVHLAELRPSRRMIEGIGTVGYDKQMFHVNLHGTRLLAEAAVAAGVTRFVFASSESVYGPPPRECPCTEETPPEPNGPYGRSKLEAELALQEFHKAGSLETVILRFAVTLGPFAGNQALINRMFRLATAGLPVPITQAGTTLKHVVHSRDAVDIIERALARPQAAGRIYNVAGAGAATVSEIFDAVTDELDSRSVPLPLPRRLLPLVYAVTGWFSDPFVLPEFSRSAFEHTCFSTGRALAELGYRPKFDTIQTCVDAARWYRENRQR
jgi:nucleoside-diphosphate-sugar epimerase